MADLPTPPDPEPPLLRFRRRLAAARAGDRGHLGELFEPFRALLTEAARALVRPDVREQLRTSDLVQSALIEGIRDLGAFRGGSPDEFAGWLTRILENNLRDRARYLRAGKRGARQLVAGLELDDLVAPRAAPSDAAIGVETAAQISAALIRLPEDYQRILLLCLTRHLTHEEAGEIMGRTPAASRVLLARARARLLVEWDRLRRDRTGGDRAGEAT